MLQTKSGRVRKKKYQPCGIFSPERTDRYFHADEEDQAGKMILVLRGGQSSRTMVELKRFK